MGRGERQPEGSLPGVPNLFIVLGWIAASAGLSGLLTAAGYIVHFSQEDLLGMGLGFASSGGALVLEGGRFIADLCLFSSRYFLDQLILVTVLIVVILAFAVIRRRRGKEAPRLVPLPAQVALLLLACIADLVYDDLPLTRVRNLLFTRVQVGAEIEGPQLPWLVERRVQTLRDAIVCSRIGGVRCRGGDDVISYNAGVLRRAFSLNLFVTLVLSVLSVRLFAQWWSPASREPPARSSAATVAVLLLAAGLILNLFGLPFAYAKTVRPTTFLEAELEYSESGIEEKVPGSSVEPVATPAALGGEGMAESSEVVPDLVEAPPELTDVSGLNCYILAQTDDRFTIYTRQETPSLIPGIWSIPKEGVGAIWIRGEDDVLKSHFLASR